MNDSTTRVTSVMAKTLSELVRRFMVVAFCGTFSFLTGVETLRAIENGQFGFGDWLTPVASTVFGLIALYDVVRIPFLLQAIFREFFAEELATHAADPSTLRRVLSRPPSKVSSPMLMVVTVVIGGVIVAIHQCATVRGETTTDIGQVCLAAGVTMLSLYGTLVLWSRGARMGSLVLGTGAIAVTLFWAAVAALVAFDQLNFDNADPMELVAVSLAILFGGVVFAATWAMIKIYGVLKRHKLQYQTGEPTVDDLAK